LGLWVFGLVSKELGWELSRFWFGIIQVWFGIVKALFELTPDQFELGLLVFYLVRYVLGIVKV